MTDLSLFVKAGPGAGSDHPLNGELTLGREGPGLVIEDPGVSRSHARVRATPDGAVIEDLGSSNGTFVNGQRIGGPVSLAEGDEIQVGDAVLELRGEAGPTHVMGGDAPPTADHPGPPAAAPPRRGAVARTVDPERRDDANVPALAAFFLGPLSLFLLIFSSGTAFYFSLPVAIAAIVLGSTGKRKVDRGESDRHRGLALAGQICGVIGTILSTLALIAAILISILLNAGVENLQQLIDEIQAEIENATG